MPWFCCMDGLPFPNRTDRPGTGHRRCRIGAGPTEGVARRGLVDGWESFLGPPASRLPRIVCHGSNRPEPHDPLGALPPVVDHFFLNSGRPDRAVPLRGNRSAARRRTGATPKRLRGCAHDSIRRSFPVLLEGLGPARPSRGPSSGGSSWANCRRSDPRSPRMPCVHRGGEGPRGFGVWRRGPGPRKQLRPPRAARWRCRGTRQVSRVRRNRERPGSGAHSPELEGCRTSKEGKSISSQIAPMGSQTARTSGVWWAASGDSGVFQEKISM